MSKIITFDDSVRQSLKKGVDKLARAVEVTMGAKGRNVVIVNDYGLPHVTKDGVTVARSIELSDPIENIGAQIVKEAASKTAEDAGDGTTTATVLARALVEEGIRNVTAGASPIELKRGIDKAVTYVVEFLKKIAIQVDDNLQIKQIATISANNDEDIGSLIAEGMAKVNNKGVITVEESKGTDTYIDIVEGLQFNQGYLSPYFVTNTDKMTAEMDDVSVLLTTNKINSVNEILPVLEKVKGALLIIGSEISGETLQTLVLNKVRNNIEVAAVKAPYLGSKRLNSLEDIAVVLGGQVVSEEKGLQFEDFQPFMFGKCDKVIVGKDKFTLIGGKGDEEEIKKRVTTLKNLVEESDNKFDSDELLDRVNKLSGGVAVLYVGAATEVELKEKKDRVDDALSATRAAVEEGIVAGGGVALLKASEALKTAKIDFSNEDQYTGIMIVYKALTAPITQILKNAGKDVGILHKIYNNDDNYGYDVKEDKYTNMIGSGIIDPAKVVRVALENAASVASLILTTECTITEEIKDK